MVEIRKFESADWPAIWRVIEPVFRAGETFPDDPDITEAQAREDWSAPTMSVYVAVEDRPDADGQIVGTYFMRPNKPGLGSHVCNCGYAVRPDARGRGVGSAMCAHSMHAAVSEGYRAMQYNLVVSTNEVAVRLWQKHGMRIIGTVPEAFRHSQLGDVDVYIMHRKLVGDAPE